MEHTVRTFASFSLVKILTHFGETVLSAYTSAMVLLLALIFPGLALGQATASLVGQRVGAGRRREAWRTAWSAVGLYATFMVTVGAVMAAWPEPFIALFDDNPAVVAEGARLLRITTVCFPFIAVALVLSKAFGGAGRTWPAMVAAATAHLAFQIPVVAWAAHAYGPVGAYWGMTAAFALHGLLSAALFVPRFRPGAHPG